jgi:hypothetical protein
METRDICAECTGAGCKQCNGTGVTKHELYTGGEWIGVPDGVYLHGINNNKDGRILDGKGRTIVNTLWTRAHLTAKELIANGYLTAPKIHRLKMKTIPFDIDKAKAGAKVVLETGVEVEVLSYYMAGELSILGKYQGLDGPVYDLWTKTGTWDDGVGRPPELRIVEESPARGYGVLGQSITRDGKSWFAIFLNSPTDDHVDDVLLTIADALNFYEEHNGKFFGVDWGHGQDATRYIIHNAAQRSGKTADMIKDLVDKLNETQVNVEGLRVKLKDWKKRYLETDADNGKMRAELLRKEGVIKNQDAELKKLQEIIKSKDEIMKACKKELNDYADLIDELRRLSNGEKPYKK